MGLYRVYNVRSSPYLATGDGATNDTSAIQTAVNASRTVQGSAGEVCIPAGIYLVTSTINAWDCFGMRIRGAGKGRTIILWAGPATSPVFSIDGDSIALSDLAIISTTGATAGIRISSAVMDNPITTACIVKHVRFEGAYTYNIDITALGAAVAANNELHWISTCNFNGYSTAAIHVWGSQSHAHRIEDCTFDGRFVGLYGVCCEFGAYIHVRRCRTEGHASADYYLQNFIIENTFVDCTSTHSARFLTVGGSSTGALSPVRVEGCYVDHGSRLLTPANTQYGATIVFNTPGLLMLHNNVFRAESAPPRIFVTGITNWRPVRLSGNVFIGPEAYTYALAAYLPMGPTNNAVSGPFSYGGQSVNNATCDGGNLFWNPTSSSYERIVLAKVMAVKAMDNVGSAVRSKNCFFTKAFSGGAQQQTVTLPYEEDDENYSVLDLAAFITDGDTTQAVSAQTLNLTTSGFDVRLNRPANTFDVTIAGRIGRVA
jgi:hypothetical protein